jgi:plastocyanin
MMKALLALILFAPAMACDDTLVTVSGTVKFNGPVPPLKVNKALANDPPCCALHEKPPAMENLVVDPNGGVRWAFVYVIAGLEGREFSAPKEAVTIDQKGCVYTPHVAGAQVGQQVSFRNTDPMLHNVHPIPFVNREYNFGQLQGTVSSVKFTMKEVPIKVVCNVHPWMTAFVCVVDHPYWAVTDAAGKFEIPGLPAGKYTIGIWHEGLETVDGKNQVEITVKANAGLDFQMQKKAP